MMSLKDIRPTQAEHKITEHMPEQVAIGYIRAQRRHGLEMLGIINNPPNPFL